MRPVSMPSRPSTPQRLRVGFYSGSFDPVTRGHTDVIARAARLVDRLVVGVGVNPGKSPLFTVDERMALLETAVAPIVATTGCDIAVIPFSGLVIDAAAVAGATVIVRGVRNAADLDYEMPMAGMNHAMAPTIDTVLLPANPEVAHIAASLVRAVATMGGDPSPFVSPAVAVALALKTGRAPPAPVAAATAPPRATSAKPPKRHKSSR